MKEACIIIPALSGNSKIPNYLTKKLHGTPLVQRSIELATQLLDKEDIYVVTNNEDIGLIAERSGIQHVVKQHVSNYKEQLFDQFQFFFLKRKSEYRFLIVLKPDTPLVSVNRVRLALKTFKQREEDVLITLKEENHSIWQQSSESNFEEIVAGQNTEKVYIESNAFMIFKSNRLGETNTVFPVMLTEEAHEVNTYENWWIGEKLLARKKVLFVVAGYPEIGMGHVFRALTLAHEIVDHKVMFLCTKESELAVQKIASQEYHSSIQQGSLLEDVLLMNPDLVVNDILNTEDSYVRELKANHIKVLNFEDIGTGAVHSDLTINELYDFPAYESENTLWGKDYLFLRDEFASAQPNGFKEKVEAVLISFGGTDPSNYTQLALEMILDTCMKHGIKIYIVTGNGYLYADDLSAFIHDCGYDNIEHTNVTGIISTIMEKVQIGISSNGRTTYELAHMNIVSMVMSHHERENTHKFASDEHGFIHMGIFKEDPNPVLFKESFRKLVEDIEYRKVLFDRMSPLSFVANKIKVVNKINDLLND